jgi:hypothetical protein
MIKNVRSLPDIGTKVPESVKGQLDASMEAVVRRV